MKKVKKECKIEGCKNSSRSKGLCEKHYRIMRLSGASSCNMTECESKAVAKGLCRKHYQQEYREVSK